MSIEPQNEAPPAAVNPAGSADVSCPGDQNSVWNKPVSVPVSSGQNTAYSWSAMGLPPGVTLVNVGGGSANLVGTPSVVGSYVVTLTAADTLGHTITCHFRWTVATASVTVASVPDQAWTSHTAITAVTPSAADSDASVTAFTWSVSPALPAGLTLDPATGTISGTPTAAAAPTTYTLTATDHAGVAGSATFTAAVSHLVEVVPVPDQAWTSGTAITAVALVAADSDAAVTAFTWSVTPALPDGVTLNTDTGKITGKPAASMPKTKFTVTATDSSGAAGSANFNITVK